MAKRPTARKTTKRKRPAAKPKSTKKPPRTLSGKKLGRWSIKRVGDDEVLVKIPAGMTIKGRRLSEEDLLAALSNFMVVKKGRPLACCSGNIAIA